MDKVLETILDSPKLPAYVEELQQYLLQEEAKRNVFYENITEDEKTEFINGKVIYQSPARFKHTATVGNLNYILTKFVRKNKLGIITIEKTLIKLRRNDFEPDICFFRKEVSDTFGPETIFFPVPDFIIEVLTPGTEKIDRGVKFVDYALNGVKEYWLVDADNRAVEQYRLETERFVLTEKVQHGTVRCQVLNGLEIPLEAIFDEDANERFQGEM